MKKDILVLSPNDPWRRLCMQRYYKMLGGKESNAVVRVTDGTIETEEAVYHFRTPVKERLMGCEFSEIRFEEDVLPEDRRMVQAYVRIKK